MLFQNVETVLIMKMKMDKINQIPT